MYSHSGVVQLLLSTSSLMRHFNCTALEALEMFLQNLLLRESALLHARFDTGVVSSVELLLL